MWASQMIASKIEITANNLSRNRHAHYTYLTTLISHDIQVIKAEAAMMPQEVFDVDSPSNPLTFANEIIGFQKCIFDKFFVLFLICQLVN